MDRTALKTFVATLWDKEAVPTLSRYIRIPNLSPMFDPKWEANGHMDKAMALFAAWATKKVKKLKGAKVEVLRPKGRTPLLTVDIPGTGAGRVLMYGHMDKQPGVTGWYDWTGPWKPAIKGGKLYGRGGADDGYSLFAGLTAVLALADQHLPYPRTFVIIEACEESGSTDLIFYIDKLARRIGTPDLVVVLDSGCGNYDQLWLTTSLRGIAAGTLSVQVLKEGVHSGDAGGVVPSSFRILRELLSRIENEKTGAIKLESCAVEVPADRMAQAEACAAVLGDAVSSRMPFAGKTGPMGKKPLDRVLNRTWRAQLAVIAIDGYPKPAEAGNVLLPETVAKLSLRLPPTADAAKALKEMKRTLTADPPYDAKVSFATEAAEAGWNAPALPAWLEETLDEASKAHFGAPLAAMGDGGAIPLLAELSRRFPAAQFLVTGVLGPKSNAHGPNEFLHIGAAKNISAATAEALAALAAKK